MLESFLVKTLKGSHDVMLCSRGMVNMRRILISYPGEEAGGVVSAGLDSSEA